MMLGGYLSAVATSHRPAVGVDRGGGRWPLEMEIPYPGTLSSST